MQIESDLGYRSAFNFIPEGDYQVPAEFRQELTRAGFEVGVHDLRHDGKLYRTRRKFSAQAGLINGYLKEWGASGFRSGFMHHNLEWLHELNIKYDSSTFDTDPFEPQPDGVHTIFPFWVPSPSAECGVRNPEGRVRNAEFTEEQPTNRPGYVELPYTLPQDSTLFLLLQEQSIEIWKKKLDWIATRGGMALVNVHPDYMAFNGNSLRADEYPAGFYKELLEWVKQKYAGQYWQATPREVAGFVSDSRRTSKAGSDRGPQIAVSKTKKPKIWIDLDNTPHVPFFEPIIDELKSRGYPVLLTARDAFQVCELADQKGMPYCKIGRHHGKHRLAKGLGLLYRAAQLAPLVLRERPALGLSHGSRSQLILSNLLHIPSLLITDYEHAKAVPLGHPTWEMVPDVIPDEVLLCPKERIFKYPGIKEDVYAWKLRPDADLLDQLLLTASDLVITVRPPANEAHYHNPESDKLFVRFMECACRVPEARIVLLPRNKKQGEHIRHEWPAWFQNNKTLIPKAAVDGMNLIWHSDLVVSGGGTMNREAAALGVPVYSIFRGQIGAVDRELARQGRLVLIESEEEAETKIKIARRERKPLHEVTSRRTLLHIVACIGKSLEKHP
jgi:hypothetical protein